MGGTTRTVAVLFCDMVASTDLQSRLGPERADQLRGRYFTGMRGAVAVHRGSEVKNLGDGLMVVFDGASDAVSCAVTMQRAVAAHAARHPDSSFELRVGVSAGEVTCDERDFFGLSVVEASRLCDAAQPGQILVADVVRMLAGARGMHRLDPAGELVLKGLPCPTLAWEVDWDPAEEFSLRVALADDSVLLRQGIAQLLEAEGIDVVLQASDAEALLRSVAAARPHVVVVDVRMPPTHTDEGLRAAEQIRAEHPHIAVLVLSQTVAPGAARRLLRGATDGVGYLLKERVGDVAELTSAIRTVASGGSAIDPDVVACLAEAEQSAVADVTRPPPGHREHRNRGGVARSGL